LEELGIAAIYALSPQGKEWASHCTSFG